MRRMMIGRDEWMNTLQEAYKAARQQGYKASRAVVVAREWLARLAPAKERYAAAQKAAGAVIDKRRYAPENVAAQAELASADVEDLDLYEDTCGNEGAYQAWSDAVDGEAFDKCRLEERAIKLEEWLEGDKEAVYVWRAHNREAFDSVVAADPNTFKDLDYEGAPYRCQHTPDMFNGLCE
jgi:hypothetical protein